MGNKKTSLKNIIKRIVLFIRKLLLPVSETWCNISAFCAKKAYKNKFDIEWKYCCGNEPEFFDHNIDLYWKWKAEGNSDWLERGVLNIFAIKMFENPVALELCCGDGFYTNYFYAYDCSKVYACDYDEKAIRMAEKKKRSNVIYEVIDIRSDLNKYDKIFTNVIWDASMAYFSADDIDKIIINVKNLMNPDGIFSGSTLLDKDGFKYNISQFKSIEEVRKFFESHFKCVKIIGRTTDKRVNVYFYASDSLLPFS